MIRISTGEVAPGPQGRPNRQSIRMGDRRHRLEVPCGTDIDRVEYQYVIYRTRIIGLSTVCRDRILVDAL